jgi:hypothetical protein
VLLADGRKISVPLAWFPRLLHTTTDQRRNLELLGDGEGIHWPDVDEDLSIAALLRGRGQEGSCPKGDASISSGLSLRLNQLL